MAKLNLGNVMLDFMPFLMRLILSNPGLKSQHCENETMLFVTSYKPLGRYGTSEEPNLERNLGVSL